MGVTHRGCFAVVTKGHQFIQEASGEGSPRWQERQVWGLGSHMGLEGWSSALVMPWPELCMAREERPGYRLRGLITWTLWEAMEEADTGMDRVRSLSWKHQPGDYVRGELEGPREWMPRFPAQESHHLAVCPGLSFPTCKEERLRRRMLMVTSRCETPQSCSLALSALCARPGLWQPKRAMAEWNSQRLSEGRAPACPCQPLAWLERLKPRCRRIRASVSHPINIP